MAPQARTTGRFGRWTDIWPGMGEMRASEPRPRNRLRSIPEVGEVLKTSRGLRKIPHGRLGVRWKSRVRLPRLRPEVCSVVD